MIELLTLIGGLIIGMYMGYWCGRTRELYESAKRYGEISTDTSWSEFLERKK